MEPAMNTMTGLKTVGAAAALAATLTLLTPSASFAAGQGWGPCTPSAGTAVGAAGPAMSAGQLMAGVGQCRGIGEPGYAGNGYGYRGYWPGGPVVTGYALGNPYYRGYQAYGPSYYTGYDSPMNYENY
jgi:hypothetical protein